MSVTARTWVEGEVGTAAKFNTIRDDLLELDAVAGIKSIQQGAITITNGNVTNTATITAVNTAKAYPVHTGQSGTSSGGVEALLARLVLTNSTTVTAARGNSNDSVTVGFVVVEYN